MHQAVMVHIWYSNNMEHVLKEEKTPTFFSEAQTSNNMQFGADADIYMAKVRWNSNNLLCKLMRSI